MFYGLNCCYSGWMVWKFLVVVGSVLWCFGWCSVVWIALVAWVVCLDVVVVVAGFGFAWLLYLVW